MRTWFAGMLIGLVLGLGATVVVAMLTGAFTLDPGHYIGSAAGRLP